ncbi:hypothetical protein DM2_1769 [Halorubrum sp. DM2]|uniref:hypothetical protein n=1 Tax=Halorubrum sp. DM2 TaxID=2527867 RepID=UPI0024B78515|nr:hypothetical protein [Halorubrum sp. DM2]VTT85731.1 hypothetical protein DM2_1769 [Halorubrum sp. DM2]
MNPVTRKRTRTCIRCHERFTELAGTVTRVCDDCSERGLGASPDATGGSVAGRDRERMCIRCEEPFLERPGGISRLCRSYDPDHVALD